MSSEELSLILSLLLEDDPEELRGREEEIVWGLLNAIKDPKELLSLADPIREAGIALRDVSLVKIASLVRATLRDACMKDPFGPLVEIKRSLSNSVRDSFFSSGSDLYLVATKEKAEPMEKKWVDIYRSFLGSDPEVRLLNRNVVEWRVERLDSERGEFDELFVSGGNFSSDPSTFAIAFASPREFVYLGEYSVYEFADDEEEKPSREYAPGGPVRPESERSGIGAFHVNVARHVKGDEFVAIVTVQVSHKEFVPFFGKIAVDKSPFAHPEELYTIFYPTLLRVSNARDVSEDPTRLSSEGIHAYGGLEVFWSEFVVVVVLRNEGPALGAFRTDDVKKDRDLALVPGTSWTTLSEVGTIKKISKDRFNVGLRTFKIDEGGKISEMKSAPMKEIAKRPIHSNVVFFDDAFYYFRGGKLHVLGKSMKEERVFSAKPDRRGTNHLLVHDGDLYWVHLNEERTGFLTKLCFPLIGLGALPPTLLRMTFPPKRKAGPEPLEF